MFPGQGAQSKGMGEALFSEFPELTDQASNVLGFDIVELCTLDPNKLLAQTRYTQPALFVVNALHFYQKKESGVVLPDFALGHSLGEYNALLVAGSFSFESGLQLVKRRGELFAEADGGGMAAILDTHENEVREIVADAGLTQIDISNFNTPLQVVVAGARQDMQAAGEVFAKRGKLFYPLNTSGAFHSRHMRKAAAEFGDFLQQVTLKDPEIDVISNVTGRPYAPGQILELLQEQICQPVLWHRSITYLRARGVQEFVEVGHGDTLTKMYQHIEAQVSEQEVALARSALEQESSVAESPAPIEPEDTSGEVNLDGQDRSESATVPMLEKAKSLVADWNTSYDVGVKVHSQLIENQTLTTRTPAMVLFGHRAAVYVEGYEGYFDLNEISVA